MTEDHPSSVADGSLTRDLIYAARYYLGGRRGLLILAAVALTAGAALNWGWLVAIGVAPVLLAVLPCVAMCALGLCMKKGAGGSCSSDAASPEHPRSADERRAGDAMSAADAVQPKPSGKRRTTDA